jgi:hypothetical protein
MARIAPLLFALVAMACAPIVSPPEAVPTARVSPESAIAAYARVLERFVDDRGRVDFAALARDREDLDAYVRFIADTPLEAFAPGDERLAHYINSYNALSMFNVIESGIPRSHSGLRKVRFFALRRLMIGGRPISLYAYENDVIRKAGDPRVHFALNCSALGCPVLPRRPFTGPDLQQELDRETRGFFSATAHFGIDHAARAVYVSELLRFYKEDFGPDEAARIAFINRHAPEPVPDGYAFRDLPFDWTIADSGADRTSRRRDTKP